MMRNEHRLRRRSRLLLHSLLLPVAVYISYRDVPYGGHPVGALVPHHPATQSSLRRGAPFRGGGGVRISFSRSFSVTKGSSASPQPTSTTRLEASRQQPRRNLKTDSDDRNNGPGAASDRHRPLGRDIARRLSRDQAISALSQPTQNDNSTGTDTSEQFPSSARLERQQRQQASRRNKTGGFGSPPTEAAAPGSSSSLLPPARTEKNKSARRGAQPQRTMEKRPKNRSSPQNSRKQKLRTYNSNTASSSGSDSQQQSGQPTSAPAPYVPKLEPPRTASQQQWQQRPAYSSLLPPPLTEDSLDDDEDDPLSTGLSSWEEFLGVGIGASSRSPSNSSSRSGDSSISSLSEPSSLLPLPTTTAAVDSNQDGNPTGSGDSVAQRLPSMQNLFPPDLSSIPSPTSSSSGQANSGSSNSGSPKSPVVLDGVLPVSDLFYQSLLPLPTTTAADSSQDEDPSRNGDNLARRLPSIQDLFPPDLSAIPPPDSSSSSSSDQTTNGGTNSNSSSRPKSVALEGVMPVCDLFYRLSSSQEEEHDDEELPFSAEQSDAVSSENNKVRIRRNLALVASTANSNKPTTTRTTMANNSNPPSSPVDISNKQQRQQKRRGRKMVRRGMEMLVGGIPINADPPQRSVELLYETINSLEKDTSRPQGDWARVISLNTRDFGPLWHTASIPKVPQQERGLFCEYWSRSALKWDICPKDLRQLVQSHSIQKAQQPKQQPAKDSSSAAVLSPNAERSTNDSNTREQSTKDSVFEDWLHSSSDAKKEAEHGYKSSMEQLSSEEEMKEQFPEELFETEGECSFELGLSREELESAPSEVFESVFGRAFTAVIQKANKITSFKSSSSSTTNDIRVEIPNLTFTETDDGYTDIHVAFKVVVVSSTATSQIELERQTKRMNEALQQAMDDGDIALALAAASKEETRWPPGLRDRIVEEWLFQDDVLDEPADLAAAMADYSLKAILAESEKDKKKDSMIPKETTKESGSSLYTKEDLYLGGGDDGVFFNYSALNALNAPYGGEIGLRLVDAVTERAKHRLPRVIAIGDVHGCIDELQHLLRECDYCPGDLVVFLGDLVCKGPDSISVVQMAREIGAIGVRGNHDFEVVRWHQAIKSGVDPPVVGSEHFHIASCLSKADMKWLYSLPWYISSKDLGALFVHAGFVSGIRLAKQNPRLMMNMRSILPDGSVTSKHFSNWPWARLWDGPQTVLFGHDADRGLQQYEHAIGLDTGCVYGGRLTACILPEKRLVSVSARREYFKYRRKHYD